MNTNIILFDDDNWEGLLPLTFTRPICELRVGILTIREKWEKHLEAQGSYITQDFLSEKFPIRIEEDNIIINSTVLPTPKMLKLIRQLGHNEAILEGDELLAARLTRDQFDSLIDDKGITELEGIDVSKDTDLIRRVIRPYDLFTHNDIEIKSDFEILTKGRKSKILSDTNTVINPDNIFIEEGAYVECAILNASTGPIYVGKNATIMEGSIVRGALAMCEGSLLKLGAKVYGATTIGPYSKVGGEINNSILLGYSNKGHEGFLGNSVLGEWCNLGADTNTSNLKNNYDEVKIWSYEKQKFCKTGLQFCGLIMGDHSKTGINTMFNTGTVVGVNANIFGSGYPRNYVPSYAWGGASGFKTYLLEKSIETAEKVMARRNVPLEDVDKAILEHIFLSTSQYRIWEKAGK
ncbi:MAG: UDP-N-acetylglucosamine diphosphorylase/glucosamine-1-phosphate N-acetyltransferase [Saprospiraceae bacterium]|jgi:UDP-N-acetylglucosamine diphosphorylase/glucosamine-1-phosphate N-acetyltransferase